MKGESQDTTVSKQDSRHRPTPPHTKADTALASQPGQGGAGEIGVLGLLRPALCGCGQPGSHHSRMQCPRKLVEGGLGGSGTWFSPALPASFPWAKGRLTPRLRWEPLQLLGVGG